MRSVNKVILVGNLGRDAETKMLGNGTAVTKFAVATSRRWRDQSGEWKEETDWTNVVLWKQEKLAGYLTRGKQVYVEGRIQTRSYEKDGEKRYSTEVVADDVILLGGGRAESEPRLQAQASAGGSITDDDVPF